MKKICIIVFCMLPFLVRAQSSEEYNPNVKEIIVVCKTHFDIGFTHRVDELVDYYRTDMIDKAIGVMEGVKALPKEQQFAWTLPGWVLYKTMQDWNGQTPERRKILDEKYRSGQITNHALPFTITSDFCGLEEMVRGLNFSSALNRKYGKPLARSGKLTDVPSHTGALATVLANAGIKFLHIGCNWPSAFVKTPGLFWWEGPDGSRVMTLYSAVYGTCYGLYPKEWVGPNDPMIGKHLLPAKDWPYKVWPAICVTGDNSGTPSAETVRILFEEVKEKMPGVKVRVGTMDDFYDTIMKENPQLPVVKEAMPDTWIHGVMCDPGGVRLSREVHPILSAIETLHTQLGVWGIDTESVAKEIALAYEQVALFGEHTWGGSRAVTQYGDVFKDAPKDLIDDLEGSWEDKTDYIRKATTITHKINNDNLSRLSANVKNHKDHATLVYNPLPWKRSSRIKVDGQDQWVKDIPASGYQVVVANKKKVESKNVQGNTIENTYYRIVLDSEKGCITSLVDKKSGKELVKAEEGQGLGQYMNERFSFQQTLDYTMNYQQGRAADWSHPGMHKPGLDSLKHVPYRAACTKDGFLKITDHGNSVEAVLTMPSDKANHLPGSLLKVSLYDDQPYFDMEVTICDKAKDNWPEADWICLPFNIDQPEFGVYRQLGVMNPATDILEGANRHLYAAEYGFSITGKDGAGIAVCPLDHPLVSFGVPGCWKYSNDYVPTKPVAYLNLYNNEWNCNFRYWYPGTWSSRVRIWTIEKGTDQEERTRQFMVQALETRSPLQTASVGKHEGSLPTTQAGVEVSRPGVAITAFGADPDGNAGTLLRVWEQAGISGKLTVTLPKGMNVSMATPVNLRGEENGEPICVQSDKFELELGAYAPASFILE